jgi:O-antigen/teichoic acid export membrane protein
MAYCPAMKLFSSPRRLYIPARGLATALALGFALLYSRQLGVTNRGYIAAIMTFTVVTLILTTSGTTLTLRKLATNGEFLPSFYSFKALIIVELFFAVILFTLEIQAFSILKSEIPRSLFFTSIIYFIASGMHLISMEVLIALNHFKIASMFEVLTVILQLSLFILSSLVPSISIATRLLLSFSFAATIISILVCIKLWRSAGPWSYFTSPLYFLKKSRGNHSIGGVLGVVDRFDRVIISWLLPVTFLAQYSVMSSFIGYFRFIPDAYSKIIVSLKIGKGGFIQTKKYFLITLTILIAIVIIILSRIAIVEFLGPEWILPWGISILFAIQEIVRGGFQVSGTAKIASGNSALANRASLFLAIFGIPVSISMTLLFGTYGVSVGFILTYAALLVMINHRKGIGVV